MRGDREGDALAGASLVALVGGACAAALCFACALCYLRRRCTRDVPLPPPPMDDYGNKGGTGGTGGKRSTHFVSIGEASSSSGGGGGGNDEVELRLS